MTCEKCIFRHPLCCSDALKNLGCKLKIINYNTRVQVIDMTDKQYEKIVDMIIKEQDIKKLYRLMLEIGEHLRQSNVMVSINTPW